MILKISTGAGKTAVALTYLQSFMEEQRQPVVYLCPTIQLVEQVCDESARLGLTAVHYAASHPHPPPQAMSAKAIIVCTYNKLFNARTTFDRQDVHLRPCALVLDDAHAGVEEVRDAFTLRLRGQDTYDTVRRFLAGSMRQYRPGAWSDIEKGDPQGLIEVPYWLWRPLAAEIGDALAQYSDTQEFVFVWGFLRDALARCRCVVSGSAIEIVPDITPVTAVRGYEQAGHRLFMSATLADDSVLVREMDCDPGAAEDPVIPRSDRGLGERMVIAPTLIDASLGRDKIMKVCERFSRRHKVVVLSPSEQAAREWESVGAEVFVGADVSTAVHELRDRKSNRRFVAFAQRYDGLDLPDDACRILVIDGLPVGEGITDRYDAGITESAGGARSRLVYRLEQGMGRAVRSHVDYAVVLLVGPELSTFIARHDVRDAMTPDTRLQLQLAHQLAELAQTEDSSPAKALTEMVQQCLGRDEDWKQYYNEKVRDPLSTSPSGPDTRRIGLATAERRAAGVALSGDPGEAAEILRKALRDSRNEGRAKGLFLQRIAAYTHEFDEAAALEIQQAAYQCNPALFRPPAVLRHPPTPIDEAGVIVGEWLAQFQNVNGSIAAIQVLRGRLNFENGSDTVEQALAELAQLVGARGGRPEKEFGEGPDDLWMWSGTSLVIEAKTGNERSLHKKDAGQLHRSLEWFRNEYPSRRSPIPVIVANVTKPDGGAMFPAGTRIVRWDDLASLIAALEKFYYRVGAELPVFRQPEAITQHLQRSRFLAGDFVKRFSVPIDN